jgi:selenocysteine lyase/cysteine desulfurase
MVAAVMADSHPIDPRALRAHYRAFVRPERVLLTGHSHQAWPDVAREAQLAAFDDAAECVDDKWERAFAAADAVRDAVVARIGGAREQIALGQNTHELVTRFLSALDWTRRRHLVTTTGEFHTIHRQLHRLAEAGVEVTFVEAQPVATLAERLAAAVRPDTAAVLTSTVLFGSSAVVPHLAELCRVATQRGAQVLLDAYHAFGVVPFDLQDFGAAPVFLVAGGYKYAQWGEGVCFLRVPPGTEEMRPVYTGWFAAFGQLAARRGEDDAVPYGASGAVRFAGSTYDPTSHYRARAVAQFFEAQGLTMPRLAASYRRQTARILDALADWDVLTPREPEARGGFVAVRVGNASEVVEGMRARGVLVDARGDVVRLGPAPYLTDEEIDHGVSVFTQVARRA